MNKITLKWEEILAGATTGLTREIESLRQGIAWGHNANFNQYEKWGMTISGALAEMSLAKMCETYFSHSVNNILLLRVFLPRIKFHYSARGHSFKLIGFCRKNFTRLLN